MRIGIDVSQLAYKNTGVANYLRGLVSGLLQRDDENEYVLFFSSLRRNLDLDYLVSGKKNIKVKKFKMPPSILNIMWNKMHIMPIENFIGEVDLFITSDWTEPPTRSAKKATIIYDLIVFKYPEESHSKTELKIKGFNLSSNIVDIQRRKLNWVKKESDLIFCISESTKNDAISLLGLNPKKVSVIYPGLI